VLPELKLSLFVFELLSSCLLDVSGCRREIQVRDIFALLVLLWLQMVPTSLS